MTTQDLTELFRRCVEAKENAYCIYSGFQVGCAVLTDDGQIFTGCNVENSSYGLTICAERVALTKAISEGYKKFRALAVIGEKKPEDGKEIQYEMNGDSKVAAPCGACRQFIYEFWQGEDSSSQNIYLLKPGQKLEDGDVAVKYSIEELLPDAFGPKCLKM
ncbi:cytidine deaminase-like [Glandiceps talaboti]